ncbi:MAG TPA: GMC family oxidoreductase N-terminal domain-containing protein [Roseiarcus sp.]|nr:GMC family oxidoreductase N-terminal domain-containing protein [Roseiarcus sp.]
MIERIADAFDYIVVGGGSSGCAAAARLSENPKNRVLLVEGGRRDRSPWIHVPATFFKVLERGRDVLVYESEPEPALHGRRAIVPQGGVLGGGSSVNAMVYIRGAAADYDSWAQMGNRAWSYERVLPVFRGLEDNARFSDEYHGVGGPLHVSDLADGHALSKAFIAAAREAGLPANADFNGATQEGVGFYQTTTYRGRRWSAARAFLREAERRGNLAILTGRRCARIIFEGRRAAGVVLEDGAIYRAEGETVLCAGALETPRLLQLSGIGDAKALTELGVACIADLPGVGENYQDHFETPVQVEINEPTSLLGHDRGLRAVWHMAKYLIGRNGVLASNVVECGGFAKVAGADAPNIQFHVLPLVVGFVDRVPEPVHGVTVNPCLLRPRSRGSVKIVSADPRVKARFRSGALTDPMDMHAQICGVELALKIVESPSLKRLVKRRILPKPGAETDREALAEHIRATSKTVFHPSGTCKMGPAEDRSAVVGQDLAVHGVAALRVADASIMPTLVSGNTNAPAIMIGARCANFILGREAAA